MYDTCSYSPRDNGCEDEVKKKRGKEYKLVCGIITSIYFGCKTPPMN